MGIKEDCNLTTFEYNWVGSIYYVGYIVAALPHNRAMQYFKPSKYIAVCVFFWGVILACMSAAHNYTGLMIARTLLGFFEAVVSAGFLLITASWYRKYEHASRVGIWSCFTGVAQIIGGLIAYGCLQGRLAHPNSYFTSWRILVLCTGLTSALFGILMFFFFASTPLEAIWLSRDEKVIVIERLRSNQQGVGSQEFKWSQFRETLGDIRTWLYILFILTSQIPLGGTVLLSSILISSLGFSSSDSLLFAMPSGAIQILAYTLTGYIADRTKQRSLSAVGIHLLALFSIALMVGLMNVAPLNDKPGQLVAYFILNGTGPCSFFMVLSMISSNVLGTTKKTMTNGLCFVAMAVAYLVGPQIFVDAPYYPKAKAACLGLWAVAIVTLLCIYTLNRLENKKRDADPANDPDGDHVANIEFMDLTDKENKLFRYVL
jgi:MFS transporter, ACS family, allantoate permease